MAATGSLESTTVLCKQLGLSQPIMSAEPLSGCDDSVGWCECEELGMFMSDGVSGPVYHLPKGWTLKKELCGSQSTQS